MAVTASDPVTLTARAQALRRLAAKLAECPVGGLAERANHETWLGPTADRCRDDIAAHVQAINDAIADLYARARRLENQAAAASPVRGVS
jgi:hypothetical protein